jgi:hypothetical protein
MRIHRVLVASASLALAFFAACVGSDPDPVQPSPDASTSSGATPMPTSDSSGLDVSPPGEPTFPPCNETAPFEEADPSPFTNLNGGDNATDPYLSSDEKRLYFSAADGAIKVATRNRIDEKFGSPVPLAGTINEGDAGIRYAPVLARDERSMFFAFSPKADAGRGYETFLATRAEAAWSAAYLPALSTAGSDLVFAIVEHPSLMRVFVSTSPYAAVGPVEVREWELAGGEPTAPVLHDELLDVVRLATNDGKTLYLTKAASPSTGNYNADIFVATRTSLDAGTKFSLLTPVPGAINTPADERATWISQDGCRLYFSRRVMKGQPAILLVATRPPKS